MSNEITFSLPPTGQSDVTYVQQPDGSWLVGVRCCGVKAFWNPSVFCMREPGHADPHLTIDEKLCEEPIGWVEPSVATFVIKSIK